MFYQETERNGKFTSKHSFVCIPYNLVFCVVIILILFTFVTIIYITSLAQNYLLQVTLKYPSIFFLFKWLLTSQLTAVVYRMIFIISII